MRQGKKGEKKNQRIYNLNLEIFYSRFGLQMFFAAAGRTA
jgi:hypothetical protein